MTSEGYDIIPGPDDGVATTSPDWPDQVEGVSGHLDETYDSSGGLLRNQAGDPGGFLFGAGGLAQSQPAEFTVFRGVVTVGGDGRGVPGWRAA